MNRWNDLLFRSAGRLSRRRISTLVETVERNILSIRRFLNRPVFFGKSLHHVPPESIVFFPYLPTFLGCGVAGIVAIRGKEVSSTNSALFEFDEMMESIEKSVYSECRTSGRAIDDANYLAGKDRLSSMVDSVRALKTHGPYFRIYSEDPIRNEIQSLTAHIGQILDTEITALNENMGSLPTHEVVVMSARIEELKDIHWCLKTEILENVKKINQLFPDKTFKPDQHVLKTFKHINSVLNSIDRLEVRGRDSAGISLLFVLDPETYESFMETIANVGLSEDFEKRNAFDVLLNKSISIHRSQENGANGHVAVSLTYKVAAEIGSLGDNIIFLRWQLKNDPILHTLVNFPHQYHTVLSHTRWASIGAITEANCHPVDNRCTAEAGDDAGIIHVCLNGDIDNYLELKQNLSTVGFGIPEEITSDTKIIPIQILHYIKQGHDLAEAFRRTVSSFEGSHAICMHSDLAPGKLFLAQRGSGQTIFIGLAEDHYIPASEVYGFVEETNRFLKLDGEKTVDGLKGPTQGQIFILDQSAADPLNDIHSMYYDGTPNPLTADDVKTTEITSRDIDRQSFPHYFLKEISESPSSVEKTLENRWKVTADGSGLSVISLDEKTFPETLGNALADGKIRRVFFIGQGTAGVAALACANILDYYLADPSINIGAMKASELSGFKMGDDDTNTAMNDTLVVAISQSGTTTDTNRTVDMVKARGAHTMAIVNRRDSDITFKVDGVMYTSSGRDIEMSVASTKAFYSQIVAGAVLSLGIASLKGRRDPQFVSSEIERLKALPEMMQQILSMKNAIKSSASRLATTRTYWAAVGSGPNKASSDEIRIKLSELCYKTISSDYIEDKKHIDLSSEPLIIVCAAGTRPAVIGDIIKDTAIFKAHKAAPVVIADEGEHRFDPYAEDVFRVPAVAEHLSPIVNTLVGHLWGYYAALAINEGSRFLYGFRESLEKTVEDYAANGLDVFELVLEKSFREKIVRFYKEFQEKRVKRQIPREMGIDASASLTLLLKYMAGKLPVPDFEIDFGKRGTALNMLNTLFECIGSAINAMARPVDAIKHQAKTVTVGTSRISEKVEGILFDALSANDVSISQLTSSNVIVLKNLQAIVESIEGAILYRIGNLDLLGEPTSDTTIEVVSKEGVLKPVPSRVESDNHLKGTKRIIVREKNVYIGKGKKDDRSIIVIPINSSSSTGPGVIENLLLLNISFREKISLEVKIKALGGKYERIKSIVQENNITWSDNHLEQIEMKDLFGISAEKIADIIVHWLG